jgi:hypothetical protein
MRFIAFSFLFCVYSMPAWAQDSAEAGTPPAVQVDSDGNGAPAQDSSGPQSQPAQHPGATTYSSGYEVRLKIHRYASYATLPLFATEFALGQSLYNNPERGSKRTAHGIIGAGIVGLFAANSVTGVWNLWESRHDENGRNRRILHSVLMLAANGGFVAAAATAPSDHRGTVPLASGKSTHRDIAVASIGVGTAGYLLMLFKGK